MKHLILIAILALSTKTYADNKHTVSLLMGTGPGFASNISLLNTRFMGLETTPVIGISYQYQLHKDNFTSSVIGIEHLSNNTNLVSFGIGF